MAKPGDRVGAICGSHDGVVEFFGYGVYEGEFSFGDTETVDPVGFVAGIAKEVGFPNPRIRLDSGQVVWGCECWWGPEQKIKRYCAAADEVKLRDIDQVRAEIQQQAEEEEDDGE